MSDPKELDLSLDELLKLAGATTEVVKKVNENSVFNFVFKLDIKKGTDKVDLNTLYKIYSKYNEEPLPIRKFSKELSQYFPRKRSNSCIYFELNASGLNLERGYSIYSKDFVKQYRKRNVGGSDGQSKQEENQQEKEEG
jgi:hypothetical protein